MIRIKNIYPINHPIFNWAKSLKAIFIIVLILNISSCTPKNTQQRELPVEIRNTYVAVLPFENNTGNSNLDVLGEMAADWITQGLIETGEGKIISSSRVNQILSQAKERKIVLDKFMSHEADIHFLIEGSYFEVDSLLIFSSSIKDIESGEIIFAFPTIEGSAKEGLKLIEILNQRILGYWLTKNLVDFERKPPIYDAYKAYLDGGKIYYENPKEAGILFEKAILLDSSFHLATIGLANNFIKRRLYEKADSIRTILEKNSSRLSPMELHELKSLEASITRNRDLQWRLNHSKNLPSYGGDSYWNWHKLHALITHFNQTELAYEFVKSLDYSKLDYESSDNHYLYFWKAIVYYKLKDYTKVKELITNLPFELSFSHNNGTPLIQIQLMLLAKIRAYEELEERLDHYTKILPTTSPYPSHYLQFFAIRSMFSADPKTAELYARKYLRFLEEENKDIRSGWNGITLEEVNCELLLALGESEKIKAIVKNGSGLDHSRKDILTIKGIYYAQENDTIKAKEIILALKELGGKYDYGRSEYHMAIIESWLGNNQRACSLLDEARKKGESTYFMNFHGDWRFNPLFDYPDFINNVPASFPLPELDFSEEDKPKTTQNYWISILGLLIGGIVLYLIYQNRQQKPSQINKNPINEPETSIVQREDEFLTAFNKVIEANLDKTDYSMPQLCKDLGVSRAQIYRKIKSSTDLSPSVYIRKFRLQKAKELLISTDLNVSEIAYQVGFKDLSYFSRSFSEEFGSSPSETRK